jgi:DNA polymerase-3 subunit epsilon
MMSARQDAITTAKAWLEQRPVYLDTETTGIGSTDSIIEITVIDHDGSALIDTLVKPKGPISVDAARIHGIHDEMVQTAPSWNDVWPEVESVLTGRAVGIYNADFDLRVIRQTHQRHWIRWQQPPDSLFFCIMKLYAQFYGQWNSKYGNYRWQSLEAAGRQCGIPLQNTHRAMDDTLLTRAILLYMAEQG